MNRFVVAALLGAAIVAFPVFGQNDTEGSKDYPGIRRMPGYYIYQYEEKQFDSANFQVAVAGEKKDEPVEGHLIKIHYFQKEGSPATSMLQVIRNYQNAARAVGGQVMDDSKGGNWYNTTLRLKKEGKEVWILIEARDDNHVLTIVEKQAMQQDVTMDATALASGLGSNGAVAIYGIYFDTAKSDLKPESDPALAEVAKLLKQNPSLKVFVVGHTDMVGDAAANMKLSQARAQAVVNALVSKHAVAATRLAAFGNGPYAPVASNKTEDGRAKNRRVELVEFSTR